MKGDWNVLFYALAQRRAMGRTPMKVLELFAGARSISKVFEARGHQTFSVE